MAFAVLALVAVVAVFGMPVRLVPLPLKLVAVTVPAVKFPLPSRATMAFAVLALVAVVAVFGMLVRLSPLPLNLVAWTMPAAKFPLLSRATMAFAVLALAAVVAEFGMLFRLAPLPLKPVAVTVPLAVMLPLAIERELAPVRGSINCVAVRACTAYGAGRKRSRGAMLTPSTVNWRYRSETSLLPEKTEVRSALKVSVPTWLPSPSSTLKWPLSSVTTCCALHLRLPLVAAS